MRLVLLFLLALPLTVFAESNPFSGVKTRWDWAIEEVSKHQVGETAFQEPPPPKVNFAKEKRPASKEGSGKQTKFVKAVPSEPIVKVFQATTAWASIKATVRDYGEKGFSVEVSTDKPVSGWALKKQSSKEIILKGGVNNLYSFSFEVPQPYIRDYGLTVYVTENAFPAFIQLYN